VLYIFAGESRKASVKDLLHKMWPDKVPNTAPPRFVELDILRNKAHDMSKKTNQQAIFQQIAARDWDIVLVSPPMDESSVEQLQRPQTHEVLRLPDGVPLAAVENEANLHAGEHLGHLRD
jgi:hypothetical protein